MKNKEIPLSIWVLATLLTLIIFLVPTGLELIEGFILLILTVRTIAKALSEQT